MMVVIYFDVSLTIVAFTAFRVFPNRSPCPLRVSFPGDPWHTFCFALAFHRRTANKNTCNFLLHISSPRYLSSMSKKSEIESFPVTSLVLSIHELEQMLAKLRAGRNGDKPATCGVLVGTPRRNALRPDECILHSHLCDFVVRQ